MAQIPDETLDHIISFVDDRKDLISPILVSKRFASIVRPHLQYRVVRCTLGTTDLWKNLDGNTVLAKNIRTLEIQRQQEYLVPNLKPPIVPKEFLDNAYDPVNRKVYGVFPMGDLPYLREAESLLIRAIKNMQNLKSFTWNRCPPLLDSRLDKDVTDDVWTALQTGCPALERLDVTDASENDDEHVRPIHHSKIWMLHQDLKSFRYHSYAYRYIGRHVPMDELTAMLRRCSNLEVLSIGFTLYGCEESDDGDDVSTADLNELMSSIHWPKLHTLRTFSVNISPSTARRFFRSHPTLSTLVVLEGTDQAKFIKDEAFQWNMDIYPLPEPDLSLLPGSLPNLKTVNVPNYMTTAIEDAQSLPSEPHEYIF